MSARTTILQCPECEGTSFEIHSDEGLITFICKHCGAGRSESGVSLLGKSQQPTSASIDMRRLSGAEDASI